jgi:L-amino acid N-acyltransferase YncA
MTGVLIRRATVADAAGIARVLQAVVAERVYSAIDRAWSVEQETAYLAGLSEREAFHVAEDGAGLIGGFQSLDLWAPVFPSMAHVGQVGTFLLPEWRGLGVGRRLWGATEEFSRGSGYRKVVAQVRGSNIGAQRFYGKLGFVECGRLRGQVIVDGLEDDEVLMERML